MQESWYKYSTDRLQKRFGTDPTRGLDTATYKKRKSENDAKYLCHSKKKASRGDFALGFCCALTSVFSLCGFLLTFDLSYILPFLLCTGVFVLMTVLHRTSVHSLDENSKSSTPSVFAIRSGNMYRAYVGDVVPGDLVLLQRGDIAFFDARLISTDGFRVLQRHINGGDGDKDAGFESYLPDLPDAEQKNMIFSHTVVSKGYAYAIVCNTYPEFKRNDKRKLKLTDNTRRISDMICIFLLCCTVISTVVSFAFGAERGHINALNAFTVFMCICAGSMCEFYPTLICAAVAKACRAGNAAVQNTSGLSKLKDITLLAFDKYSSLCPDASQIEKIYTCGVEYGTDKQSLDKCRELIYTAAIASGKEPAHTPANISLDILLSRLHLSLGVVCDLYPSYGFKKNEALSLLDCHAVKRSDGIKLCCRGSAQHVLYHCSRIVTSDGVRTLSDKESADLLALADNYVRNGAKILACASRYLSDGKYPDYDLCFEGFLIMQQTPDKKACEAVRKLSGQGMKLLMFCDDISDADYNIALDLGIVTDRDQVLNTYQLNTSNLNILKLKMENYRLFQGLSAVEKKYILDHLAKTNGEKIGILTNDFADTSYAESDSYVLFGVDPSDKNRPGLRALKYSADVSLPNVTEGGGITSAYKLITNACSLFPACIGILRYQLFSFMLVLILSVLGMIFGIYSPSPSQILVPSLLLSTVTSLFTVLTPPDKNAISKRGGEKTPSYMSNKRILRIFSYSLICAVTSFVCILLSGILTNDSTLYSDTAFYSLLLTLLTAYLLIQNINTPISAKKEWRCAIPCICIILSLILLSLAVPEFLYSVDIGVFSFGILPYTLPPCLVLVAVDLIRRARQGRF